MKSTDSTVVLSLTVKDVAAALDFYQKAFGAQELTRMPLPDGTVVQADLAIGDTFFYISPEDAAWKAHTLPEGTCAPCLFVINTEDSDAAFAKAIAAGATEINPPTTQFWGMKTAIVADPFGYRWNVRQILEDLTHEEIMQRAQQAMG